MEASGLKSAKGIIAGILGLTLVILVHEFGHYIACKAFHVRTITFSIGFGPKVVSVKPKETTFQISAIPFGGYVEMDTRAMSRLPYIKKIIIMLAGIIFNIIFALLIFLYLRNAKPEKLPVVDKSDSGDSDGGFVGPIGIISLMGKSIDLGYNIYLRYLAVISLNIAFFNILPIPFFDGGQIFKITIEAITGKFVSSSFMNFAFYVCLVLLVLFSMFLSVKDIKRIVKK